MSIPHLPSFQMQGKALYVNYLQVSITAENVYYKKKMGHYVIRLSLTFGFVCCHL